jgi:hypothetical protein
MTSIGPSNQKMFATLQAANIEQAMLQRPKDKAPQGASTTTLNANRGRLNDERSHFRNAGNLKDNDHPNAHPARMHVHIVEHGEYSAQTPEYFEVAFPVENAQTHSCQDCLCHFVRIPAA